MGLKSKEKINVKTLHLLESYRRMICARKQRQFTFTADDKSYKKLTGN
jgi:hypothetical protein